jgi:hypothetical protein
MTPANFESSVSKESFQSDDYQRFPPPKVITKLYPGRGDDPYKFSDLYKTITWEGGALMMCHAY